MKRMSVKRGEPSVKSVLLRQVTLFKGLSDKDLRKISRYASFHHYKRGEQIFSKDSSGDCLYVLVSGRVKIYAISGTLSKTFALLDPGDFFGEMALLGEHVRSASARSLQDSELLILKRKDFRKFLNLDSDLTLSVLETLCERLRRADKQIEMLAFQNVLGRTAMTLSDLHGKYGKPVAGGSLIDAEISQQELADLVGTAREMVSRVLSHFRKMNALALDKTSGKIVITNLDKLRNCIYQ